MLSASLFVTLVYSTGTVVYAALLSSPVTERFNPYAVLVSAIQRIVRQSCVRFELFYNFGIAFSVRVPKCIRIATDIDEFGLLLDVKSNGLGNAWHNVWLPLEVITPCDAQIQFEVLYDTYVPIQMHAAIGDVTVLSNGCLGTQSAISCRKFFAYIIRTLCYY